jgi:hypothetical protein
VLLCPDVWETTGVIMLRHFGDCSLMSRSFGDCAIMLRRFGGYLFLCSTFPVLSVLLLCSDISETVFADMLRRFGGCLCSYTPTFWRLAVMLRRFGFYMLICCDVTETICALKLRRFRGCLLLVCSEVSETAPTFKRLSVLYAWTFRNNSYRKTVLSVFADLASRIRRIARQHSLQRNERSNEGRTLRMRC